MSDGKGKEPDVVFVGDSLVQLMHQFGVNVIMYLIYYFIKKIHAMYFSIFFFCRYGESCFLLCIPLILALVVMQHNMCCGD